MKKIKKIAVVSITCLGLTVSLALHFDTNLRKVESVSIVENENVKAQPNIVASAINDITETEEASLHLSMLCNYKYMKAVANGQDTSAIVGEANSQIKVETDIIKNYGYLANNVNLIFYEKYCIIAMSNLEELV